MKAKLSSLLLLISMVVSAQLPFAFPLKLEGAEPSESDHNEQIKMLNLIFLPSGRIIATFQNTSGKPIKAFRGKWFVLDDFNDISKSADIHFASDMLVLGSKSISAGGYIIPPGGVLGLATEEHTTVGMTGQFIVEKIGDLEKSPPTWRKRFKASITDIIFDEHPSVTDTNREVFESTSRVASDGTKEPNSAPDSPLPPSTKSIATETTTHSSGVLPDTTRAQPINGASRRLSVDEISSLDLAGVQNAINEIYARYGTVFPKRETQAWAERQTWYHQIPGRTPEVAEQSLTENDRFNIEILAARRNALKSR